jgi:hypothetical protein
MPTLMVSFAVAILAADNASKPAAIIDMDFPNFMTFPLVKVL